MEFVVQQDGTLTERSIHELAEWYSRGSGDPLDFEAHLLLLKAYNSLISSAQRGRRTLVSVERFTLLRLLYRLPEQQMQMTEIGRALGVSPTSITKLVKSLVTQKLVERIPHETDKRRTWIRILDRGVDLVERTLPSARQSTRERWKGMTEEEKRQLVHLLARLIMTNEGAKQD